jgi:outer membrane protein TolC
MAGLPSTISIGDTAMKTFAFLFALLLSGCASFSEDGGFGSVNKLALDKLDKSVIWAKTDEQKRVLAEEVSRRLAKPLSVDDAVQIALLNNRGLQAAFGELGLSEADLVSAGRLPNPHFSMLRASKNSGGIADYKIEQVLVFNVFSLVMLPQRLEMEKRRFEQTQRTVGLEMVRLAADTRKAYFQAIAASQSASYQRQVMAAAEASAELAQRMAKVGNFNKLQQAREQSFYADAALGVGKAELVSQSRREALVRLMGLSGAQLDFKLPERLPDLPDTARDVPDVVAIAMTQRLDLQAIKLHTEALAKNLGLTKASRFINVLEFGPARVLEGQKGDPYKRGFELSFELPIFDWGSSKVAKAQTLYEQQLDMAAAVAVNAGSEVRQAYGAYRITHDLAKHYRDEIVPLRKRISDENLLRYNGMFIGVFELLADARSQISAVAGYIDALRDFWLAQADLEMAMLGKPSLNVVGSNMSAQSMPSAEH